MAKHNTNANRRKRQKLKEEYMKVREDAQLHGVVPTTPEGAIRDEVVPPSSQDEQRFPGLDRRAIREDGKGWSVPEPVKRKVVEAAAEVMYEKRRVTTKDGLEIEIPPDRRAQVEASRILLNADQKQYERDNPAEAGKARGGNVKVGVEVNVGVTAGEIGDLLRRADEQRRCERMGLAEQEQPRITDSQDQQGQDETRNP